MIAEELLRITHENVGIDPLYLRNLLKEQLQFYVLNFIYSSGWGENLLFKGGSCLRMFFALPRLSEDLDLDIQREKSFDLKDFVSDLEKYFSETLQDREVKITASAKGNIVKLKFPVHGKKILFLRIDFGRAVGKKYKVELSLKSTYDFSFLVRRYALPDLFSGKLAAILGRTARVKGRDYFDLAWFLEKKIAPNFCYLREITAVRSKAELKRKVTEKVKKLDLRILRDDLAPLFRDKNFAHNFVASYKEVTLNLLSQAF